MTRIVLIVSYLAAIVVANLTLAEWGREHPEVALYNAFAFIGLDLVARDRLHDYWRHRLFTRMALLIASGSALSYLLGLWLGTGPDAGRIALASCAAFAAAATADTLVYRRMGAHEWLERINRSNVAAAAVDSLVFVALWPFGFSLELAFTLFAAKVAGGVTWSLLLWRLWVRESLRPITIPASGDYLQVTGG
jgi:uncharacterized PurR-regulated membrane protein YhhQ (DUF165 family)